MCQQCTRLYSVLYKLKQRAVFGLPKTNRKSDFLQRQTALWWPKFSVDGLQFQAMSNGITVFKQLTQAEDEADEITGVFIVMMSMCIESSFL